MILYHISMEKHKGLFIPRIPTITMEFEDERTKRVCVSSSVQGCLNALPNISVEKLKYLIIDGKADFWLYVIDTDKYGIVKEDIKTPSVLTAKEKVIDARITKEHWITTSFQVKEEDIKQIKIHYCEESNFVLYPRKLLKKWYKRYEIELTENLFEYELFGRGVPTFWDFFYTYVELGEVDCLVHPFATNVKYTIIN